MPVCVALRLRKIAELAAIAQAVAGCSPMAPQTPRSTPPPTTSMSLRQASQLEFVSPRPGWMVLAGQIATTTDAGRHWQVQTGLGGKEIGMDFLDPEHGWAVVSARAHRDWLYGSVNGGRWSPLDRLGNPTPHPAPSADVLARGHGVLGPRTGLAGVGGHSVSDPRRRSPLAENPIHPPTGPVTGRCRPGRRAYRRRPPPRRAIQPSALAPWLGAFRSSVLQASVARPRGFEALLGNSPSGDN